MGDAAGMWRNLIRVTSTTEHDRWWEECDDHLLYKTQNILLAPKISAWKGGDCSAFPGSSDSVCTVVHLIVE